LSGAVDDASARPPDLFPRLLELGGAEQVVDLAVEERPQPADGRAHEVGDPLGRALRGQPLRDVGRERLDVLRVMISSAGRVATACRTGGSWTSGATISMTGAITPCG
jgi:hypothetical protein